MLVPDQINNAVELVSMLPRRVRKERVPCARTCVAGAFWNRGEGSGWAFCSPQVRFFREGGGDGVAASTLLCRVRPPYFSIATVQVVDCVPD